MNNLLESYCLDVEFPSVSGAEHLALLRTRDRLATMEAGLSPEEQQRLLAADQRLVAQAALFHAELARFIHLAEHRLTHDVPPSRWWWYLDVLSELPLPQSLVAPPPVLAP